MEDGVTKSERLALLGNLSSMGAKEEEDKETDQEHEKVDRDDRTQGEERANGLIDHFISNLVSDPLSPTGPRELVDEKRKVEDFKFESNGEGDGGGTKPEEDDLGGANTGGWIINNIISNFFYPSDGEGGEREKGNEEEKDVKENEQVNTEKKAGGGGGGGGSGGIINNLVSHLPTSLPDDGLVPATDEASILLHSIVHD